MSDANRLLFLRIALVVIGLTFIFGIYALGIVWPSGWDLGPRTFALSADDYRSVCAARCISAHRIARSLYVQEHYLVYRVVERGSRRDHDRAGLQRRRRTRPFDSRCACALPRGDRSCGIDAPDCALTR